MSPALMEMSPTMESMHTNRVSYIASLVSHLQNGPSARGLGPAIGLHHGQPSPVRSDSTGSTTLLHQFPHTLNAYRYLGGNALIGRIAPLRQPLSPIPACRHVSPFPISELDIDLEVTPKMHKYLVNNLFSGIHLVYPIIDPGAPFLRPGGESKGDMAPNDAFSLQMLYSISCLSSPDQTKLSGLGVACYRRALLNIENATVEPSLATLQVATLLALHSLLDPMSGNIGQHVGLAVRLLLGLADTDGPDVSPILWSLYPIVYILENQVATVLDRPTTFPEPAEPIEFESSGTKFLCSIYRLQSRFRNGIPMDTGASIEDALAVFEAIGTEHFHPNIVSTAFETQLLIEPSPAVAIRLLQSYMDPQFMATFVTPHWIHSAGMVIRNAFDAEDVPRSDLLGAFGTAVSLLTKLSFRWPGASVMMESLRNPI